MTDPVSGEMASQAIEQVADQAGGVDEVDGAEPTSDFSEMMESHQQPDADVQAGEQVQESMQVDGAEEVDRVEEVSEIPTDDFVQELMREESNIHEMMERCLSGNGLDQQEMLQMQAVIYSYSQRVELTTKVVEAATGGIEQVMNTQV